MLPKTNIGIISIFIIFFFVSDASGMLTRLRPLAQSKKINFRKYTTAKEKNDLQKRAAQQFKLTDLFLFQQCIRY